MHLVFYLRGVPEQIHLWKAMARSQFFKWRRIDKKTGKEEISLLQAGLRESVLGTYEYTFPKEALSTVLAMMGRTSKNKIGCEVTTGRLLKLAVLRKLTGTRKIPNKYYKEAKEIATSIDLQDSERGLSHLGFGRVSKHIIGIKYDKEGEMFDPLYNKTFIQELI